MNPQWCMISPNITKKTRTDPVILIWQIYAFASGTFRCYCEWRCPVNVGLIYCWHNETPQMQTMYNKSHKIMYPKYQGRKIIYLYKKFFFVSLFPGLFNYNLAMIGTLTCSHLIFHTHYPKCNFRHATLTQAKTHMYTCTRTFVFVIAYVREQILRLPSVGQRVAAKIKTITGL